MRITAYVAFTITCMLTLVGENIKLVKLYHCLFLLNKKNYYRSIHVYTLYEYCKENEYHEKKNNKQT